MILGIFPQSIRGLPYSGTNTECSCSKRLRGSFDPGYWC